MNLAFVGNGNNNKKIVGNEERIKELSYRQVVSIDKERSLIFKGESTNVRQPSKDLTINKDTVSAKSRTPSQGSPNGRQSIIFRLCWCHFKQYMILQIRRKFVDTNRIMSDTEEEREPRNKKSKLGKEATSVRTSRTEPAGSPLQIPRSTRVVSHTAFADKGYINSKNNDEGDVASGLLSTQGDRAALSSRMVDPYHHFTNPLSMLGLQHHECQSQGDSDAALLLCHRQKQGLVVPSTLAYQERDTSHYHNSAVVEPHEKMPTPNHHARHVPRESLEIATALKRDRPASVVSSSRHLPPNSSSLLLLKHREDAPASLLLHSRYFPRNGAFAGHQADDDDHNNDKHLVEKRKDEQGGGDGVVQPQVLALAGSTAHLQSRVGRSNVVDPYYHYAAAPPAFPHHHHGMIYLTPSMASSLLVPRDNVLFTRLGTSPEVVAHRSGLNRLEHGEYAPYRQEQNEHLIEESVEDDEDDERVFGSKESRSGGVRVGWYHSEKQGDVGLSPHWRNPSYVGAGPFLPPITVAGAGRFLSSLPAGMSEHIAGDARCGGPYLPAGAVELGQPLSMLHNNEIGMANHTSLLQQRRLQALQGGYIRGNHSARGILGGVFVDETSLPLSYRIPPTAGLSLNEKPHLVAYPSLDFLGSASGRRRHPIEHDRSKSEGSTREGRSEPSFGHPTSFLYQQVVPSCFGYHGRQQGVRRSHPPPEHHSSSSSSASSSPTEEDPASGNNAEKGKRSKVLYMPGDERTLSNYQCLLRKQIEVFEATEDDVQFTISKMSKPVSLGQVGIRCAHCAVLPQYARPKAAIYFPRSLVSSQFCVYP